MSEFPFHCPHCGQLLTAMDDLVGERVDCPNPICGRELTVPARDEADTPSLKSSKGGFGSSFGTGSAGPSTGGSSMGSVASSGSAASGGGARSAPRSFSKRQPGDASPPVPPPVPGSESVPPPPPPSAPSEMVDEEEDGYALASSPQWSPPPPESEASAASEEWGSDADTDADTGKSSARKATASEYNDAYDFGDLPPQSDLMAKVSLSLGVASLVLSTVCCCIPLSGLAAVPLGIAAVITGIVAIRNVKASGGQLTGDPMAVAGIICGAISLVLRLIQVALTLLSVFTNLASGQ